MSRYCEQAHRAAGTLDLAPEIRAAEIELATVMRRGARRYELDLVRIKDARSHLDDLKSQQRRQP